MVELRVTVSKMELTTLSSSVRGIWFYQILLSKKPEDVVKDRLLVSDEAVRVLDVRE